MLYLNASLMKLTDATETVDDEGPAFSDFFSKSLNSKKCLKVIYWSYFAIFIFAIEILIRLMSFVDAPARTASTTSTFCHCLFMRLVCHSYAGHDYAWYVFSHTCALEDLLKFVAPSKPRQPSA